MAEQTGNTEKQLSDQTDAELYLGLKAGHTNALGILYDRHAGLVYGLALKTLGNAQEAEDLTQDIFLNLIKATAYDSRRGSFRTFVAILTRSRAIDRVRSRSTVLSFLERWRPISHSEKTSQSPIEYLFQNEQSQAVQTALAQLSESEQQVLRLAYYEGLSQSEIARQLGIPLGTIKTTTRRSLLKLRQFLTDYIR
ncbi:MAG: sigma-70 family RNA polymerase sigma factor [Drouetiella hepatica Uher 2000/2452]|jgi:RNA polymerase sigma-70 factor (ECF subfamily)|uniref:Sigma-70 family RNA polymerase sigma factor n=1 Tax=Drouetiella hepatica Uher 2000/2452 TaxID=904376 RepID=A0A951QA66_9CYAN|nr:sigma-70 family RNA polymerase sigma factor [Drouetiella hepatica Uher 2000/2452]